MTDLISRKDAVKTALEYQVEYCGAAFDKKMQEGMIKKLNDIPSAEPQWILCSERMPETADEVLTTYIVNGDKKKRFVQTSTYYDNEEEGFWSSPWDEYLVPNTKIEVLAWMPLPNPYKGDKE